jgi:hypothetical protein
VLDKAAEALNDSDVRWFLAKGADLKRSIYAEPSLRPTADIDLFVEKHNRETAIAVLKAVGFDPHPLAETLRHEIKMSKHGADVDLHWHLLRPGRHRPGLLDWLFSHREKFGDYWGLDATASLLVMLVHPAITKYLLSPTSMLIHQVDQARLVQSGNVDWEELHAALEKYGLKTAAWSSLYVLRKLGGIETTQEFEARIRPGRLKENYLKAWIDRAWITRWFDRRWLVSGFFSLGLQDSLDDAVTALYSKIRKSKTTELSAKTRSAK